MPKVELAFTPNTHFTNIMDFGAVGANYPDSLELVVPREFWRRTLYMRFQTDPLNATFLVRGVLRFTLSGQLTGEIPMVHTTASNSGLQFGQANGEDGMLCNVGTTPVELILAAYEVICACDKITWITRSQSPAAANRPVWFFGCKSSHYW